MILRYGFVLSAVAVAWTSAAQARTLDEIKKSQELRVCLVATPGIVEAEPDGCAVEKCKFSGAAFELVNEFAKSIGAKPKYALLKWDEQFQDDSGKTVEDGDYTPAALKSGKCDVYPNNLTILPWRQKKLGMVTLFPSRKMVLVKKDARAKFGETSHLGGKTVVVEKSTSFHRWVEELNAGELKANPVKISFAKPDEVLPRVSTGKADFTLMDSDAALASIRTKFKGIAPAFPVGAADEIGWAMAKEAKDLQEAVKGFFDTQKKTADSKLNSVWKDSYGMSFESFSAIVGQVNQ